MVKRNIKIVLAYDGSGFFGFQRQKEKLTVQGELERVLQQVLQEFVRVNSAGRTDAGVHAWGQVVSFKTGNPMPADVMFRAVHSLLLPSIIIRQLKVAPFKFNARFWAKSRTYRYCILQAPHPVPYGRDYFFQLPGELDLKAMQKAAKYLVGEHDFSTFQRGKDPTRNPVRKILRFTIKKAKAVFPGIFSPACFTCFEIEGESFLPGMVRKIMGSLVRVGKGEMPPRRLKEILASGDPLLGGPPLPPSGLYLFKVDYPPLPLEGDEGDKTE